MAGRYAWAMFIWSSMSADCMLVGTGDHLEGVTIESESGLGTRSKIADHGRSLGETWSGEIDGVSRK